METTCGMKYDQRIWLKTKNYNCHRPTYGFNLQDILRLGFVTYKVVYYVTLSEGSRIEHFNGLIVIWHEFLTSYWLLHREMKNSIHWLIIMGIKRLIFSELFELAVGIPLRKEEVHVGCGDFLVGLEEIRFMQVY